MNENDWLKVKALVIAIDRLLCECTDEDIEQAIILSALLSSLVREVG